MSSFVTASDFCCRRPSQQKFQISRFFEFQMCKRSRYFGVEQTSVSVDSLTSDVRRSLKKHFFQFHGLFARAFLSVVNSVNTFADLSRRQKICEIVPIDISNPDNLDFAEAESRSSFFFVCEVYMFAFQVSQASPSSFIDFASRVLVPPLFKRPRTKTFRK